MEKGSLSNIFKGIAVATVSTATLAFVIMPALCKGGYGLVADNGLSGAGMAAAGLLMAGLAAAGCLTLKYSGDGLRQAYDGMKARRQPEARAR